MSTFVLLRESQENPEPPLVVAFSGEGTTSIAVTQLTNFRLNFSGEGAGSARMSAYSLTPPLANTGEGVLTLEGRRDVRPEMKLSLLDDTLIQAPTAAQVVIMDGFPNAEVRFYIDGMQVHAAMLDSDGSLLPTSVPVPEAVGQKGEHILTAIQTNAESASISFTLDRNPALSPLVIGPDAQAVDVAGAVHASGRKWILQDLMPGGLGSYVLPVNPDTMSSPHFERRLTSRHTTSASGQYHVFEGGYAPVEWTFSGYCPTKEMHDKLLAYGELNRRLYIIDHRGRAWKVAIVQVELEARLTQMTSWVNFDYTEYGHDFTVNALVYDRDWVTPA